MLLFIADAMQLKRPEAVCPQTANPGAVPERPAVDALDSCRHFDVVLHVVRIRLPEVGGHWKGSKCPFEKQLNMGWISLGLQQSTTAHVAIKHASELHSHCCTMAVYMVGACVANTPGDWIWPESCAPVALAQLHEPD